MTKVSANRVQEREAVNATRALFEAAGHIVDEPGSGSDFGEDLLVSFVENGERNGVRVFIQVKGGKSHRSGSGYAVRAKKHAREWRCGNPTVLCVVHDPEMRALYWENATRVLRERFAERNSSTTIRISESSVLHKGNLATLVDEMRAFTGVAFAGVERREHLVSRWRGMLASSRRAERAGSAPRGRHPNLLVEHLGGWIDSHPAAIRRIACALGLLAITCCLALMAPEIFTLNSRFGYAGSWKFVAMLYSFFGVCFAVSAFENHAGRRAVIPRLLGGGVVTVTYLLGLAVEKLDNSAISTIARAWLGAVSAIVHYGLLIGACVLIVHEVYRRRRVRAIVAIDS